MKTRVIVTADDFGLSKPLNRGILHGHLQGAISSAALLISGPASAHAIALAKQHPSLEVGLHLAFVESCATFGRASTVTTDKPYFADALCLHPNWKAFLWRWVTRQIRTDDLQRELESQFKKFLREFGSIAFVNSTQHLHLFPKLQDLVLDLCVRYQVPSIRALTHQGMTQGRGLQTRVLSALSRKMKAKAHALGIRSPERAFGFEKSGKLKEADLLRYLEQGAGKTLEIVGHPGFDDPTLFDLYPGAFHGFEWKAELDAVCSPVFVARMKEVGAEISRFQDLEPV